MEAVTITGRAAALVSKYTEFDLSDPIGTPAHKFTLLDENVVENGVLRPVWSEAGYRVVGTAEIKIQILPMMGMLTAAVDTLRAQRVKVIADAQAEAVRLDGEIQKLLAITYEAAA